MNRRSAFGSLLCSEWDTPVPAVMNCTAPRPSISAVPMLSAWVRDPRTTYVQISALL